MIRPMSTIPIPTSKISRLNRHHRRISKRNRTMKMTMIDDLVRHRILRQDAEVEDEVDEDRVIDAIDVVVVVVVIQRLPVLVRLTRVHRLIVHDHRPVDLVGVLFVFLSRQFSFQSIFVNRIFTIVVTLIVQFKRSPTTSS